MNRALLPYLVLCAVVLPIDEAAAQSPAHFVVGIPGAYPLTGSSYVLVLTDPADIAEARALIAGGGFAIVGAVVTTGSDGINRDVVAPNEPLWSWHVSEFVEFTGVGAEICDGGPELTEQSAQGWPPGHEEIICYWTYTVVDEIPVVTPAEKTSWGAIKALFRAISGD